MSVAQRRGNPHLSARTERAPGPGALPVAGAIPMDSNREEHAIPHRTKWDEPNNPIAGSSPTWNPGIRSHRAKKPVVSFQPTCKTRPACQDRPATWGNGCLASKGRKRRPVEKLTTGFLAQEPPFPPIQLAEELAAEKCDALALGIARGVMALRLELLRVSPTWGMPPIWETPPSRGRVRFWRRRGDSNPRYLGCR